MKNAIVNSWYCSRWFNYLLLPFSWLYRVTMALRYRLYCMGILQTYRASVPVIIVGNITVGGTGKTPVVCALVEILRRQGFTPGIVSRGYGGQYTDSSLLVASQHGAHDVGDEVILLYRKTQAPTAVAKKRAHAVRLLLSQTDCDVIISDDGLQHYALGRDIELAVVDGQRGLGNGWCLPAGPLREPSARLSSVDIVLTHTDKDEVDCRMMLRPECLTQVASPYAQKDLALLQGKKVHAVAGIGYPQRFFSLLESLGCHVVPHVYSDHHQFVPGDLDFSDDLWVIMTEKDAVKCEGWVADHVWYLPVSAHFDAIFMQNLSHCISKKIQ